MKNKFLSQQIAKKFKNKHRKNTFHPKSCIKRKWKKYTKNWCKKCQRKNCKFGTKKELKRLKQKHFKEGCNCNVIKEDDIGKINKKYIVKPKKYPNIRNPMYTFNVFAKLQYDDYYSEKSTPFYDYRSMWTPPPYSRTTYQWDESYWSDEDGYLFDYIDDCVHYKNTKNKYLSGQITKKFKNKHKNHKYKKFISRKKRKRQKRKRKRRQNIKKTHKKSKKNIVDREYYEYSELYEELKLIYEFCDDYVLHQELEEEPIIDVQLHIDDSVSVTWKYCTSLKPALSYMTQGQKALNFLHSMSNGFCTDATVPNNIINNIRFYLYNTIDDNTVSDQTLLQFAMKTVFNKTKYISI